MTLPVSTSCRKFVFGLSVEGDGGAVFVRVVRYAVDPAGPDDAYPGALPRLSSCTRTWKKYPAT